MLSPIEDFWLRWHVDHSNLEIAEQARLVLEAESGSAPDQVAADLGVTTQAVEGLLATFEHDRLATFPRPKLKLAQLIKSHAADAPGCQYVVRLARRLFNQMRPLHHLPGQARRLLEAATWLHCMTEAVPGRAAQYDQDLLAGANLADYSPDEQLILSCVLQAQRRGFRAGRDPIFRSLRPADQSRVRHLAALLQVAVALNHSGTQSTNLVAAKLESETVSLRLTGTAAEHDAANASRHATLWQPVFHLGLACVVETGGKTAAVRPQAKTPRQGEPVGEVFGQELKAALRKWPTAGNGADQFGATGLTEWLTGATEAEAALAAFGSVLKRQPVKAVRRPLRALAKRLHAAVEHQDALGDLRAYGSSRTPGVAAELQPMSEAWERAARREQAALWTWQKSQEAAQLYGQLADLAAAAPVRRRKATNLRMAAPVLLDELFAEVAEGEAALAADHPKTYRQYQRRLAALVCALRGLRQATGDQDAREALEGLLGDMQRLDGHLSRWLASRALNDAIAEFLDTWAEQQAKRKAPQLFGAQAVLAYRQARRAQWSRLRSGLPASWRPVRANRLRRRLEALLKLLEHSA